MSPDRTVIAAANQGSQGTQLLSHIKTHINLHGYLACIAVNKPMRQTLRISGLALSTGLDFRHLRFRLLLACDVHSALLPDLQGMTQSKKLHKPRLHAVMTCVIGSCLSWAKPHVQISEVNPKPLCVCMHVCLKAPRQPCWHICFNFFLICLRQNPLSTVGAVARFLYRSLYDCRCCGVLSKPSDACHARCQRPSL